MSETSGLTRILCVDDEPQLLSALKRVFRGSEYAVDTAGDGFQGLEKIKENQYDVIISDMRMPHMDGAEFLTAAAQLRPECPRILLTGFSDHESTVRAINDGKIFSFVSKPWNNDQLRETVQKALDSRQLAAPVAVVDTERVNQLEEEKNRLENESNKLLGEVDVARQQLDETSVFLNMAKEELRESYATCIKVFSNLINGRLGSGAALNDRITNHVVAVASILKCSAADVDMMRNAAMLHQIGKMSLPDSIIRKPLQSLSHEERDIYSTYPVKGEQVLMPLDIFQETGRVIRHQHENFDGSGGPDGLEGVEIPLGSRILRVVMDYLSCLNGTKTGVPLSDEIARSYILAQQNSKYDPAVVTIYFSYLGAHLLNAKPADDNALVTQALVPGMKVMRDVFSQEGLLLVAKNTRLTVNLINHLRNHEVRHKVKLSIPILHETPK